MSVLCTFGLKETPAYKYLFLSAIFNLCSEENYCVFVQLIIFSFHMSASVIEFISNSMLYSSMLVICVNVLVLLVQLVVFILFIFCSGIEVLNVSFQ